MAAPGEEVLVSRRLVLVPVALILAGCGTTQSSSEGSGPTKNDASTSRIELTTIGSEEPDWASMTAIGVIDYANHRGDLVIRSKTDSPGEVHSMFIGREEYLGANVDGKMLWEKQSPIEDARGTDRFLPGPGGTSPDRVLAALEAASTKVEPLGVEKVRGVEATHYKAHLSKAKFGEDWDNLPKRTVVDAWIDESGLARRIRVPDGTFDFYDYGVQADIEAPSPDDVLTEKEFDKLMSKECANEKAGESTPVWCFVFGADLVSGSTGYGPTETMPSRVTDGK
jgi:hypothetical protein